MLMLTKMIEKLVRYLKRRSDMRFRKYCIRQAIRVCKGTNPRHTANVATELYLFLNRIFHSQYKK